MKTFLAVAASTVVGIAMMFGLVLLLVASSGCQPGAGQLVSTQQPTSVAGPQGPAGPQGVAGPQGPRGYTGAAGAVGLQGVAGPQGPAGPAGVAGMNGQNGSQGPQGPAGAAGTATGTPQLLVTPFVGVQATVTCTSAEAYLFPVTLTITGPAVILIFDSGVTSLVSTGVPITGTVNIQLDGNTDLFQSYVLASPVDNAQNPPTSGQYPLFMQAKSLPAGMHQLSIEVTVDPLSQCGTTETAQIDGQLMVLVFSIN